MAKESHTIKAKKDMAVQDAMNLVLERQKDHEED